MEKDATATSDVGEGLIGRLWEADLIRPALKSVRLAITIVFALSGLLLLWSGTKLGTDEPFLIVLYWLSGICVLFLIYAVLMIVPDLLKLVSELDVNSRVPGDNDRPRSYLALQIWSGYFRLAALGLLFMAVSIALEPLTRWLLDFKWHGVMRGFYIRTWGDYGYNLRWPFSDPVHEMGGNNAWMWLWSLLMILGFFGIFVSTLWDLLKDLKTRGWRRLRKGTLFKGLLIGILLFVLCDGGLRSFLMCFVAGGWAIASLISIVSLIRRRNLKWPSITIRFIIIGFGLIYLLFNSSLFYYFPVGVYEVLDRVLSQEAKGLFVLAEFKPLREVLSPIGGILGGPALRGFDYLYRILHITILAIAATFAWMKSDLARALINIERNLRPKGEITGSKSTHAFIVSTIAKLAAGIIILGTLLMLLAKGGIVEYYRHYEKTKGFIAKITSIIIPMLPLNLTETVVWCVTALITIFGLVALYRLSFDLAAITGQNDKKQPLSFMSLKTVVKLQVFLAWVAAIGITIIFGMVGITLSGGEGKSSMVKIVFWVFGGGLGAIVFLILFLFAGLIRSFLELEANTRPTGASPVLTLRGYPGLSTLAGLGKGFAILFTGIATITILAIMLGPVFGTFYLINSYDADAGYSALVCGWGIVALLLGGLSGFLIYVITNSIPDFVRLLLTIERNFTSPVGPIRKRINALTPENIR